MKKSLKDFTYLMLYLMTKNRLKLNFMPIKHLAYFIEGLKKFKGVEIILIQQLQLTIAFKTKLQEASSEEELKRINEFIQKMYA